MKTINRFHGPGTEGSYEGIVISLLDNHSKDMKEKGSSYEFETISNLYNLNRNRIKNIKTLYMQKPRQAGFLKFKKINFIHQQLQIPHQHFAHCQNLS